MGSVGSVGRELRGNGNGGEGGLGLMFERRVQLREGKVFFGGRSSKRRSADEKAD